MRRTYLRNGKPLVAWYNSDIQLTQEYDLEFWSWWKKKNISTVQVKKTQEIQAK
jgi:hypothetical protein